ncbi:calmodulin-binding transcription activator 2-like isoform X1 [Gossypium arboreum]|uniref:calmodulin-binding transcription activator 2-like isoform X1 n=1 Tax=Gossypium arboreum TaxID=29729 RepID=UPI00081978B6|nr:calmodulin-binding transcription activator 2-like isoform X1 [Gossypium arboreum]XP_052881386.1 calmodulin-binding transcription activator 2-like isoform X1 [Gossypium arboreum]
MADRASYSLAPRLDIDQILLEAQHRWLRPAEICEILRNYQKFHISSEPPTGPPSGSLFLFDRKVLRYFRKDGHNWRKKKDGKTVKEAHEKLKVGSIDVLHCYYAHGEENENFQRRSYWMLEQDLTHIVFVHYLEVKGRTIGGISHVSNSQTSSPSTSSYPDSHTKAPSGNADSTSPTSTLTSLCEDADSEDGHQASSRFCTLPQQGNASVMDKIDSVFSNHCSPHQYPGWSSIPGVNEVSHLHGDRPRDIDYGTCTTEARRTPDLPSWEQDLGQYLPVCAAASSHTSATSIQPDTMSISLQQQNKMKGKLLTVESASPEFGNPLSTESNWQIPSADNALELPKWLMDSSSNFELPYDTRFFEQKTHDFQLPNALEEITSHDVLKDDDSDSVMKTYPENDIYLDGNVNYAFSLKKSLLNGEENLKKVDSFSRWITKELGEVDDLQMQSSSGLAWSTVECGNVSDDASLSPSLSQDQLFSIVDFSPKWAYIDLETEKQVLIIGTFLKSQEEVAKYNWSCMFGEVEVPAEVIADGILSCYAPPHNIGQVPFYVTCTNRVACSEVREFDYRAGVTKDINVFDIYGLTSREMLLRLKTLLSLKSFSPCNHHCQGVVEKRELIAKIISMKEEEERHQFVDPSSDQDLSEYEEKERLLQRLMKEKLYSWLLHKIMEDGKGPNILDEKGQGVLHLAAALGYDWAINPTVSAGVSINFRDVNGWTALHWAAFCGRERTVAILVSVGAAPGALTDPSPEFPLARTPADLASANGHKGISGFLAESSLTSYLSSLTMDDQKEAVQTVSDRIATSVNYNDAQDILSLKDSITAVCNATQAADRIHQMFRMQSFQWKQLRESSDAVSDEHVISLLTTKTRRPFQSDGVAHAAATQIQKKFRGWKKRKEFLLIRQRIVKIQAHVRGHQVRKQYKTFVWSVGILEKVILRWRRKGSGLRGFRRDAIIKPDPQCTPPEEDEYDFLKEGRKQTEERFQKALTRVKSMAQNSEGRGQYRRLLTLVQGIQENKACNMVLNSTEEVAVADEDFLDVDSLLDDDTFMSIAFE